MGTRGVGRRAVCSQCMEDSTGVVGDKGREELDAVGEGSMSKVNSSVRTGDGDVEGPGVRIDGVPVF